MMEALVGVSDGGDGVKSAASSHSDQAQVTIPGESTSRCV